MGLWIGFDLQAEIETGGDNNSTALHFAALKGKEAVAAQLLQAGASVSAVSNGGLTPLHIVALNGKSSIANLLLQTNASPTAVKKDGRTPSQSANHQGHGDIAVMLLEAEQAAALKLERIPLVTLPLYTPRNIFKPSLWCCGLVLIYRLR